jgi:hypothetical protein
MSAMNTAPILDIDSARRHISTFSCPDGFSAFAWRQLQQTALSVWHAHLAGMPYRGSLHFCRPEFYNMLVQPGGQSIVSAGQIRRFIAA